MAGRFSIVGRAGGMNGVEDQLLVLTQGAHQGAARLLQRDRQASGGKAPPQFDDLTMAVIENALTQPAINSAITETARIIRNTFLKLLNTCNFSAPY